jgi:hypothetical protein
MARNDFLTREGVACICNALSPVFNAIADSI